jgi:hypothetical protein
VQGGEETAFALSECTDALGDATLRSIPIWHAETAAVAIAFARVVSSC